MLPSAPRSDTLAGICDCHVHVLDPQRFPYAADRTYTPAPATVTDLEEFMATTGAQRVVVVQPSVYGTDNSALLDALAKLGPLASRGIAVIDSATTPDNTLDALRASGVRALRVNVAVNSDTGAALAATIERAAPFGLAVEIYADMNFVTTHRSIIETSPVPIILDHYAGVDVTQPGNGLASADRPPSAGRHVWVKLSAPYRLPNRPPLADVEHLAHQLIAARGDRVLWASDWPHTGRLPAGTRRTATSIDPFHTVDTGAVLTAISRAAGSSQNLRRILVDNPAALFGF